LPLFNSSKKLFLDKKKIFGGICPIRVMPMSGAIPLLPYMPSDSTPSTLPRHFTAQADYLLTVLFCISNTAYFLP
jgi:hypothetical protein